MKAPDCDIGAVKAKEDLTGKTGAVRKDNVCSGIGLKNNRRGCGSHGANHVSSDIGSCSDFEGDSSVADAERIQIFNGALKIGIVEIGSPHHHVSGKWLWYCWRLG